MGRLEKRREAQKGDIVIKERVQKVSQEGQGHIHVVVHRKDKSGKLSLSPMANSRGKEQVKNIYYREGKRITKVKAQELSEREGKPIEGVAEIRSERRMMGFDRTYFKHYAEAAFDHKFDYGRKEGESFWDYNKEVKDTREFFKKHKEKLSFRQEDINYKNKLRGERRRTFLKIKELDPLKRGIKSIEGQLKGELQKELGIPKEMQLAYRGTRELSKILSKPSKIYSTLSPEGLATKLVSKRISLPIKLTLDLLKVRGIEF